MMNIIKKKSILLIVSVFTLCFLSCMLFPSYAEEFGTLPILKEKEVLPAVKKALKENQVELRFRFYGDYMNFHEEMIKNEFENDRGISIYLEVYSKYTDVKLTFSENVVTSKNTQIQRVKTEEDTFPNCVTIHNNKELKRVLYTTLKKFINTDFQEINLTSNNNESLYIEIKKILCNRMLRGPLNSNGQSELYCGYAYGEHKMELRETISGKSYIRLSLYRNQSTSQSDIKWIKNTIKKQAKKIAKKNKTTYQKVVAASKLITKKMTYNSNYGDSDSLSKNMKDGYGVCEDFANYFSILMSELQIPTIKVSVSKGHMNHAWNMVKVGKKWYHIDVSRLDKKHFLQSDKSFKAQGYIFPKNLIHHATSNYKK